MTTVVRPEIDHEFQSLIPPLAPDELAQLEANILADGCRDALTVWRGLLMDGHHRFEICTRHGLPFHAVSIELADRDAAMDWIDANQLGRRNLSPDAFKLLLGRRYNRAKKTQFIRIGNTNAKRDAQSEPRESTAERLAEQHGVSRETVKRAGKFADEVARTPALRDAIKQNRPVLQVKREMRRDATHERIREQAAAPALTSSGKLFPVLYVDPPWRYEDGTTDATRVIENQYPTMTLDDIKALDVPALDDAVMFMWATSPKLAEAFEVLGAWGFNYRTCAVWVKPRIGMGYYFRQRHELLLVATRGSLPVPEPSARRDSVFTTTKTLRHSEKPSDVRETIATMYPDLPRIELFARTPAEGWAVWGNEVSA